MLSDGLRDFVGGKKGMNKEYVQHLSSEETQDSIALLPTPEPTLLYLLLL